MSEDLEFEELSDTDDSSESSEQVYADNEPIPPYEALISAPDFSSVMGKSGQSRTSREYERKMQSLLKAGVIASFKRGNMPDAAAFLHHGPGFARAVGDASDESDRVRKAVDMITAPDSAIVPLALTAIALGAQLIRNHQAQAEQVATDVRTTWKQRREEKRNGTGTRATTTVKLPFGKKLVIRMRIRIPGMSTVFRALTGSAVEPERLAYAVFSDDKLRLALKRHGIIIQERD